MCPFTLRYSVKPLRGSNGSKWQYLEVLENMQHERTTMSKTDFLANERAIKPQIR